VHNEREWNLVAVMLCFQGVKIHNLASESVIKCEYKVSECRPLHPQLTAEMNSNFFTKSINSLIIINLYLTLGIQDSNIDVSQIIIETFKKTL